MSNMKKGKSVSWSKNSEDGKLLYQMLLNKEIDMKAQPRSVLETMGWVGKYRADSFRGGFNRMREEIKDTCTLCPKSTNASRDNSDNESIPSDVDDEMVGVPADRRRASLVSALKKQKVSTAASILKNNRSTALTSSSGGASFGAKLNTTILDSMDLVDSTAQPSENSTTSEKTYSFPPMYWQWMFDDGKHARSHICICVCLPSGLCYDGNFRGEIVPSVASDGMSLTVRCLWPSFFTDLNVIKAGLVNGGMSHDTAAILKNAGLKEVNNIRCGMNKSIHQQFVTSTVIPLKYEVEPAIKKFSPIFHRDSCGMCVAVILKVRVTEIGEVPTLVQPFAFIEKAQADDDSEGDDDGL